METPVGVLLPAWIDQLQQGVARAAQAGEVPIAALCVDPVSGELSWAENRVERDQDPLAHAECLAIQQMSRRQHVRYLTRIHLISSLEPCVMCVGAIANARIPKLTYFCQDEKDGYFSRHGVVLLPSQMTEVRVGNHRFEVCHLSAQENCFQQELSRFFRERRR